MENISNNLFSKYWNKCHFLKGNGLYVYKEDDLSQEEIYLIRRRTAFVKELGYVGDTTPWDKASQKRLKWIIKTHMLMDAHTKKERKVLFGEF